MAQESGQTVKPSRRRYANAADVLPPDVYREVRKHFTGVLYVGRRGMYYQDRARMVGELHAAGVSIREIAKAAGISVRRVHQILAEGKEKK